MKIIYKILPVLLLVNSLFCQSHDPIIKGEAIYKSSQHIYIKFDSYDNLSSGDTIYVKADDDLIPVGIVKYLSSSSCAAEPFNDIRIGETVYFKEKAKSAARLFEKEVVPAEKPVSEENEVMPQEVEKEKIYEENFYARFGVTSYSDLTNRPNSINKQRWKYLTSVNYENISGSSLSLTGYLIFSYRTHQWNEVQNNLGAALKIYDLSLGYDFSKMTNIWLGRKINRNLANIGTIDGVQFTTGFGSYETGLVLGSRPHFSDYGYNAKLFQYGAFLARTDTVGFRTMRNSLAFFQQTNNFVTDRRFLYFQHNNNLFADINIFLSTEVDLYKRKNNLPQNAFSLTSFYVSTRYSPERRLSLNLSYDARKNVVYYETYKTYADSILESAMRQGLRFGITLRPARYMIVNLGTGYRSRKGDKRPARNYNGSVSYSRVPFINSSLSLSGNYIITNYMDGTILGLRMYKDLFDGLLNAGFGYRNIKYAFTTGAGELKQNVFEMNLSFRFFDDVYLSLNYEGVFQERDSYTRIYLNLTKRFR